MTDPITILNTRPEHFERLIANYFIDPPSEGWAVLMSWKTPAEV